MSKIKVKEVWLARAEGYVHECVEVTVKTLDEANAVLAQWRRTAPSDGSYHKCDFTVTYEDGNTYQGRYDLSQTNEDGTQPLECGMQRFLTFLAGTYRPAWVDDDKMWAEIRAGHEAKGRAQAAREFLEKYDVLQ